MLISKVLAGPVGGVGIQTVGFNKISPRGRTLARIREGGL